MRLLAADGATVVAVSKLVEFAGSRPMERQATRTTLTSVAWSAQTISGSTAPFVFRDADFQAAEGEIG
jgi:hypothetical protein